MKASFQIVAKKQAATAGDFEGQANRKSILAMLASKDAANLETILQLPVVPWPEYPNVLKFDPYGHFLPYLLDHDGSATRWSYGLAGSQMEFQTLFAAATIGRGLPDNAVKFGYDGVLLEKSAFSESDALSTEAALLKSGAGVIFNDERRELFRLPSSSPSRLPDNKG
jgi:hypothetical protein